MKAPDETLFAGSDENREIQLELSLQCYKNQCRSKPLIITSITMIKCLNKNYFTHYIIPINVNPLSLECLHRQDLSKRSCAS